MMSYYKADVYKRQVLLHALGEMAVSVKSKSGRGVSKIALNGLYVITSTDGIHRVSMAQIREADTDKASGH